MPAQEVNASPTKAFFIDSLTRDLTLEDAILDLVDNSIDGAIQTQALDVSASLLHNPPESQSRRVNINTEITSDSVCISDAAGGIDPDLIADDVFRLGRPPSDGTSTLGVYGIGLKRAVFKMGSRISVSSWHPKGAFEVQYTPEWLDDDTNWTLPIKPLPEREPYGTTIAVKELHPEILIRVSEPELLTKLNASLSETYSLFLQRLVTVHLNGNEIAARDIPLGQSDKITPAVAELHDDDVNVEILAGLAPRKGGTWTRGRAGWYVLCNGRVVVFADKTELTGWGVVGPQFTPKHRGFVGVAFFFSDNPSLLPWTTTKRGLNRESRVFQLARHKMVTAARPVITFLNNMYPSDAPEEIPERELADSVESTPIHELTLSGEKSFSTSPRKKTTKPATVSVQYRALKSDIARAKKWLAKPSWGANKVGSHALEYFLEQECPK